MLPGFLYILYGQRFERVAVSSLLYIRKAQCCTELVTTKKIIPTNLSLAQIEKSLSADLFCRISNDTVVSIEQIICFNSQTVQLPGTTLQISKRFLPQLKSRITILNESSRYCVDATGKIKRR